MSTPPQPNIYVVGGSNQSNGSNGSNDLNNSNSVAVTLKAIGGDGKVNLSWTVTGTLANIQVYRDTDADPNGRVRKAILRGDALSYIDNTVINGQQYWYWIKYTDTDNEVGNSNADSATPQQQ